MPALRHRAAHFVLKKLGFFNRSYIEEAFGRRFKIPIINGRKSYVHEPWMANLIAGLFKLKQGGFIDVGVNLGQTMLKVAAADPQRAYLGFEPNPACADYAQELAVANNLPYVIIPAGLGVRTSVLQLQMFRDEGTDPSASLVEGFRQGVVGTKPVVVLGVADIPRNMIPDEIAIVKIDVEGGEAEVIEGIMPMLKLKRPYVIVEILPAYNAANVSRIERQKLIEKSLGLVGYAMSRIHPHASQAMVSIEPITEIGIHGDLGLADYLMVPSEDVGKVNSEFASWVPQATEK